MTVQSMLPIPAGAIFTVTCGEYSDYSVEGVFRAVAEINTEKMVSEYLLEHPEQSGLYVFKEKMFIGWLARKGVIEAIDSYEWYLGAYYSVAEMDVRHPGGK